ncbi:uncharacterized protein LOC131424460 [Marmota monax]|uniref:uncharacterized protein LOC131424460 n=1 Tax=Marmota monax TaxID=9995 RepID=UPI0026F2E414|nr:uncharacterized protein LOC131424460 [Marmota monax]XP_058437948.1 uncharacterized protein LOC131424460 [Marmota monax]
MAQLAQRRAEPAPALAPGAAPSEVTFELGQGVQLRLATLAAELRRALRALLSLRLAHRFPGEAVHFLRGRDGGAGSPRRRRRRRHLCGPGAWQLRRLLAPHRQRQRRQEEEAGERRGELAPLRPELPATPPSRSRAPPSFSSPPDNASRPHLSAGGSWSPRRGELPGLTEGRAGVEGGEEVVDSGRGGRVEGSLKFRQLRRERGVADAECASRPFSPSRQPASRPAPQRPLPEPSALPGASSRGAAIADPLGAVVAVPSLSCQRWPLIARAVTRCPDPRCTHTRLWQRRAVRTPLPQAPASRPRRNPASDRYNLRRWLVQARENVCACARTRRRAARGKGFAGGWEGGV